MHPAAHEWDLTHLALNGMNIAPPTSERPCDYCGLPLLCDGIYIHDICMRAERTDILLQAKQYLLLTPKVVLPTKESNDASST